MLTTVPITNPYLLMSDTSPVEGSTLWMSCKLENGTGPIQYLWHHESRSGNITTFAQSTSSSINVTNVSRNNTGWYRCEARNDVNSESSNRLLVDIICECSGLRLTKSNVRCHIQSDRDKATAALMYQHTRNLHPCVFTVWCLFQPVCIILFFGI